MKSLTILGATGTIGQNCLKVLDANPGAFEVVALTANDNAQDLANAAITTNAKFAAIANADKYTELKHLLAGTTTEVAAGEDAIIEAAAKSSDVLLAGIVGAAGLIPTLKAVERGATIALANKECLVCAGDLFMQAVKKHGATLIPVDSEHNAIFQILQNNTPTVYGTHSLMPPAYGGGINSLIKITLTASGGPFREWSLAQMQTATPKQAVAHPNWRMGAKISVDSATMVNKGLELIEAMHLFGVAPEMLDVLVHPESIIHGLVEMKDGSVLAQMSEPDMCVPIAYALGFPARMQSSAKRLNLAALGKLTFEAPDEIRFPALKLARDVMLSGGGAACIFNAANEIAVQAFLEGKIGFLDIVNIIEQVLTDINHAPIKTLNDTLALDKQAREITIALIQENNNGAEAKKFGNPR